MANEELLALLKAGVEGWNKWRKDLRAVFLRDYDEHNNFASLAAIDLRDAAIRISLRGVDFSDADLDGADLIGTDLSGADISNANLKNVNFTGARLSQANLSHADLRKARFWNARLFDANLTNADLRSTDFRSASLQGANFCHVDLRDSNFAGAGVSSTRFENSDLSEALGLEDVRHDSPSALATSTFVRSKGKIPEAFLRGCGLSDWEIEAAKLYNPDLSNEERNRVLYKIHDLQASQSIQISPLFISYSHADRAFVDKIEDRLKEKGVRFWRDTHDMKAGRIETQIDTGIRQNPIVLLILSENSIKSDWVQHEVRTARSLEQETGRDVLCPVALDRNWRDNTWPKRVMEQVMEYKVLDFSAWEDDGKFDAMFRRLIDGLEIFYKR